MATVAAIALTVPAAAQDQPTPLKTEQESTQQLERAPEQQSGAGEEAGAQEEQEEASEPAQTDRPPLAAEQQPAEEAAPAQEGEAAPPAEMAFIEVQDEAQFLADDEVIGKSVINVMDEEVGTIADLVMDQEQKLVGVVLSVGGFLGIGEKWVAIPVDQIEFPTDEQPARLLVAVTEEQLKNAPDFMTRKAVEAEQAQQQAMEQQQQVPSPATGAQ
jgi:hypothetical protein